MYGLKQASKTWCHNFQQTIQMYGFNKSTVDHSTFIYSKGQIMVIAPLYVDDRYCSDWKFRTSHQGAEIDVASKFRIKDLGLL